MKVKAFNIVLDHLAQSCSLINPPVCFTNENIVVSQNCQCKLPFVKISSCLPAQIGDTLSKPTRILWSFSCAEDTWNAPCGTERKTSFPIMYTFECDACYEMSRDNKEARIALADNFRLDRRLTQWVLQVCHLLYRCEACMVVLVTCERCCITEKNPHTLESFKDLHQKFGISLPCHTSRWKGTWHVVPEWNQLENVPMRQASSLTFSPVSVALSLSLSHSQEIKTEKTMKMSHTQQRNSTAHWEQTAASAYLFPEVAIRAASCCNRHFGLCKLLWTHSRVGSAQGDGNNYNPVSSTWFQIQAKGNANAALCLRCARAQLYFVEVGFWKKADRGL